MNVFQRRSLDSGLEQLIRDMDSQEFVPEDIPWAHLDIAGPCFIDKPLTGQQYGATGFGVRLLTEWLSQLAAS